MRFFLLRNKKIKTPWNHKEPPDSGENLFTSYSQAGFGVVTPFRPPKCGYRLCCMQSETTAAPELDDEFASPTDSQTKPTAVKSSLRILNIEDNANDAELNEAMLSARWPQCQLLRVDNRDDFIAALEHEEVDLILSDYTMPGFNGLEALNIARERRPDLPFLFVSGTIGEDAAIEAMKNGATDYVLKHRLMRLIPAVDRALREADEHAERENAEQAMRESEHKYRTLFECLGDAAFLTDEETGKIIDTNQRAETMLGCSRGEILGNHQFLSLDEAGAHSAAPVVCKMTRPDGSFLQVEVRNTWLTLYGRTLVLRLCHEIVPEKN
jgi:PAS domain S-box-containing protein